VLVVREYAAQYADPITVHAGDRVLVGADDPAFPGWRWCRGPDGREGWVPEQLLRMDGSFALMLEEYTARELSVEIGADVTVRRVVDGWAWVAMPDGRAGWIPQACIAAE
jgi:SH3-like domain-containing protein